MPGPGAGITLEVMTRAAATARDDAQIRHLFDGEYRSSHGLWDPAQPYGYAAHDMHILARNGDEIVGHAGWGRRRISVGGAAVVIAGVGGVLVTEAWRGRGLGARLMEAAAQSMRETADIEFGYLGCREGVVPFYTACGWRRITATERFIGRDGAPSEEGAEAPLLILPIGRLFEDWPDGEIDLRGRAW